MKILFLTLYPEFKPSTRLRVMQLLPYLGSDTTYRIRPLLYGKMFKQFYSRKNFLSQLIFHLSEVLIRLKDIAAAWRYDVVFLQKGITTMNYVGLHRLLFMFNRNIIFDFDDAINLSQISSFNKLPFNLLNDKKQVLKIIKMSKTVITGNAKLKEDILSLNDNITVVPTCVDADYYKINPGRYEGKQRISILWSGNRSGHAHLKICVNALRELAQKYPLDIIILSDIHDNQLRSIFGDQRIEFIKWSQTSEKDAFSRADIGIMPMYDTLWMRRKCAFKALLYMINGIPTVSSPCGIITDIIKDGENGLLVDSNEEWQEKLESLIKQPNLRKEMGLKARKVIEEKFALSKWGPYWNEVIRKSVKNR